ncbi:unnamed protein product [Phytophthora fragariaefolia]|uniref:Unnamed protein product n=1 Tax=Phytophthora fragariaefolia TaxID=1490495 RepID=A0A9W7D4D3_9STRA|nr:unnamed protein product [Phytophthora fragariaefolia]
MTTSRILGCHNDSRLINFNSSAPPPGAPQQNRSRPPSAMQAPLAQELAAIFQSLCKSAPARNGNDIVEQWARCIHRAFYGVSSTRGSNKFLALESTLADFFARLSEESSAQLLWEFAVRVLLLLAQESAFEAVAAVAASGRPRLPSKAKTSAKKCQPNAPLAFLVVNALRRLVDRSSEQAELCRLQGTTNEELRTFCAKGLGGNSTILLADLVGLFKITDIDSAIVLNALEHLLASKSHAALIKLCETFPGVNWPFETIVVRMVQAKDWTSAELLVLAFEHDMETGTDIRVFAWNHILPLMILCVAVLAKTLINETINIRDFKRVHIGTYYSVTCADRPPMLTVDQTWISQDALYSRDGLLRLIETQRWQLAITFVGHDITLQKVLLEHLVATGEFAYADQLVKKVETTGVETNIAHILQHRKVGELRQLSQLKEENYLTLTLANDNVVFCDSDDVVRSAMEHFFGDKDSATEVGDKINAKQIVGLDVEWKPVTSRSKSTTAVASILQIASAERVFIIDLLALHVS